MKDPFDVAKLLAIRDFLLARRARGDDHAEAVIYSFVLRCRVLNRELDLAQELLDALLRDIPCLEHLEFATAVANVRKDSARISELESIRAGGLLIRRDPEIDRLSEAYPDLVKK